MKKTKFWSMLMLAVMVSLVVSCGDDGDNGNIDQNDQTTLYEKKIEGTWKLMSTRIRDESNDFKKVDNYERTISFSNNKKTYKIIEKDYSIQKDPEKATIRSIEGMYSIKKNGESYILYRKKPHLDIYLESWDYIEFANDYETLTLLESRPSGYLDIDEKYARINP